MPKPIRIFDTTLRDGTQGEHISFSAEDKFRIAKRLDEFGIHYIEGGWPGSNPKDMAFFEKAKKHTFRHAKVVAFGSTCRAGNSPEEDTNLRALIQVETPAVSVFGKTWLLHVEEALNITPEENLKIISGSVNHLKAHNKEVIYDAEHFFDGYRHDPDYAIRTLLAAECSGADVLVLCDTNGGTLPHEISGIVHEVKKHVSAPIGIHAHNDCELAVANTLAAVQAGANHVQGTVNGYGERCGNANLCSVIPNLQLKMGHHCVSGQNLPQLSTLMKFVGELANLVPDSKQPYVGKSAFAHKGGVHVSAVMKNAATYEHIAPEKVGNRRRVLISDLSGKSNLSYKSEELGFHFDKQSEESTAIVQKLKTLENEGFRYEAAEASFELLVKHMTGQAPDYFDLEGFRVIVEQNAKGESRSEATIKVRVNGQVELSAAEGNGPVHALDAALRRALCEFYPEISAMSLRDYKVRVLNEKKGTGAKVRVLIDSAAGDNGWGTVGVSENIIDASWQALSEGVTYFLMNNSSKPKKIKPINDGKILTS
ncbi:citramalate synthase [Rhodohalobacter mucosus]|uniref:Citramalate synthase n=1 Tax=Rhodohalobacter mucosus TaxID=2079485 RepID=A0A316TPU7_9BACT|nr:citramalate synthase [Rhodohalobacter mucosus]PWN05691.1 citramalate synthase [Rhodohalobacter mucosus]